MENQTFVNPILSNGADPWVIRHPDGSYYMMVTLGDRIALWHSPTLSGLGNVQPKTVWTPEPIGPYSFNLWAPELHLIDGRWYIYYTANDGGGDATRRICVLELAGDDPMNDEWQFKSVVNTEFPGLDGTVIQHQGELYFFYSGYGHFPDYGSAIYAARMTNPWTLTGPNVLITAPTKPWEKQGGMAINEGPVLLRRNGWIFLVFSASATWSDDYCLGITRIPETADLLDANSWIKEDGPVFAKILPPGSMPRGITTLPYLPTAPRIGSFTMRTITRKPSNPAPLVLPAAQDSKNLVGKQTECRISGFLSARGCRSRGLPENKGCEINYSFFETNSLI